ncbi:hypothetical protein PSACC_01847 [Paramicrosporidium saccamoebae]|uniref:Secreted protein n=1 Tax=Paramicrosporidium saccamoebae TaxID=1246581 RepID=A0A2H9TKT2_9FUNG|nr:hypothetical protein PSACC_01847 [Paramicrosporidium saccamoebae]
MWWVLITGASVIYAAAPITNLCDNPNASFQLDTSKLWKCQSDSIGCYNNMTRQVVENLRSTQCNNTSCLAPCDQKYSNDLRKTLYDSLSRKPKSAEACPIKWTEEMEYSANIVLQKSQKCQVDYVGLFTLFEMAQQLFRAELQCAKSGSKPTTPGDTLSSLLGSMQGGTGALATSNGAEAPDGTGASATTNGSQPASTQPPPPTAIPSGLWPKSGNVRV